MKAILKINFISLLLNLVLVSFIFFTKVSSLPFSTKISLGHMFRHQIMPQQSHTSMPFS